MLPKHGGVAAKVARLCYQCSVVLLQGDTAILPGKWQGVDVATTQRCCCQGDMVVLPWHDDDAAKVAQRVLPAGAAVLPRHGGVAANVAWLCCLLIFKGCDSYLLIFNGVAC
jgi:hypothetical protein